MSARTRMKTVILEAFEDSNTGTLGLGVRGMPRTDETNAAYDGLTIAHDLIEHVNGVDKIGSIDDELEALGAIWYVRGRWGELRRENVGNPNVHENIAADVVRMFRDFFHGAYVNINPPRTRACDEADDDFRDIIRYALTQTRAEVSDGDEDVALIAERERTYMGVCLPRMRIGYRKAKARYEWRGRFAATNLFWEIAEAVDVYAKRPDEGAMYKLTYGFKPESFEAYAYCEEHYPEDYQ